MTLHLGLPHHHHQQHLQDRKADQQRETREAKRHLKEKVRDDWDYPPLPAYQSPAENASQAASSRVAGFRVHTANTGEVARAANGEKDELGFDPVGWRELEYSDEAPTSDEEQAEQSVMKHRSHSQKIRDKCRFEGPESVGTQVLDRKLARKRKRQKALDEEVGWNEGLAHWMARRDVWCCARTREQVNAIEARKAAAAHPSAPASASSANSTPRSSTSSTATCADAASPNRASADTPSTSPDPAPATSPTLRKSFPTTITPATTTTVATTPTTPPSTHLHPLAPPLLPNNPIRTRITPASYPEIHAKIILQSRTPAVPINLATLTRAVVQGWIDEGEWPPKPAVPGEGDGAVGRRRGRRVTGVREGVRALGRALGVGGGEDGAGDRGAG